MKIRLYQKSDLDALIQTIQVFKKENHDKRMRFPAEYVDVRFYKKKIIGVCDIFVASENGYIAGFVVGHPRGWKSTDNYWERIVYTAPDFRKRGIAAGLSRRIIDIPFYKGYRRIQSKVEKRNTESVRLHEKLRFSKGGFEGKESIYNREFYLMTRKLG